VPEIQRSAQTSLYSPAIETVFARGRATQTLLGWLIWRQQVLPHFSRLTLRGLSGENTNEPSANSSRWARFTKSPQKSYLAPQNEPPSNLPIEGILHP
jgi:hypothetical protein